MAVGSEYAAEVLTSDGQRITENGLIQYLDATNQPATNQNPVTSGTLPQLASWVSGTAQQNPVSRPVTVVLAPTGDASNNAATVAIALSPDNSTYTTVATWSLAAAVNLVGAITTVVPVLVPTGWYIKCTIGAHATLATSTYY
jgi:hypothetical protein